MFICRMSGWLVVTSFHVSPFNRSIETNAKQQRKQASFSVASLFLFASCSCLFTAIHHRIASHLHRRSIAVVCIDASGCFSFSFFLSFLDYQSISPPPPFLNSSGFAILASLCLFLRPYFLRVYRRLSSHVVVCFCNLAHRP